MKLSLATSLAVAGCVLFVLASELAAQRPTAPGPKGAAGTIDMAEVTKNSTRFKQQMERLKGEYQAKAEELKKEGERGNQLTEEARKLPAGPERKQLEQELLQLRADYELHGKRVTEDIRDGETKIVLGMIGELKAELERYAKSNQMELILRTDPSVPDLTDPRMILQEIHKPIVYQRGMDVTPPVLEAMNRRGPAAAAGTASSTSKAPPAIPPRNVPR